MNHTESGKVAIGAPNSLARRKSEVDSLGMAELRHIWLEVERGRGRHGSFLTHIAEAATNADPSNFTLLTPVLLELIWKYELYKYLDTYRTAK